MHVSWWLWIFVTAMLHMLSQEELKPILEELKPIPVLWGILPIRTSNTLPKYEKHFPKMYRDVGMAVPKTTQTRYMDGSVQAT